MGGRGIKRDRAGCWWVRFFGAIKPVSRFSFLVGNRSARPTRNEKRETAGFLSLKLPRHSACQRPRLSGIRLKLLSSRVALPAHPGSNRPAEFENAELIAQAGVYRAASELIRRSDPSQSCSFPEGGSACGPRWR